MGGGTGRGTGGHWEGLGAFYRVYGKGNRDMGGVRGVLGCP